MACLRPPLTCLVASRAGVVVVSDGLGGNWFLRRCGRPWCRFEGPMQLMESYYAFVNLSCAQWVDPWGSRGLLRPSSGLLALGVCTLGRNVHELAACTERFLCVLRYCECVYSALCILWEVTGRRGFQAASGLREATGCLGCGHRGLGVRSQTQRRQRRCGAPCAA